MINIANLTINIQKVSDNNGEVIQPQDTFEARNDLVDILRVISKDIRFQSQTVVIPEGCEKYGFAEGNYDLPDLLYFLADMLE